MDLEVVSVIRRLPLTTTGPQSRSRRANHRDFAPISALDLAADPHPDTAD